MTRKAAVELKKDDKRPLDEPAHTSLYAPHAVRCDVGLAAISWTPDTDPVAAARSGGATAAAGASSKRKQEQAVARIGDSEVPYEVTDETLRPNKRGEGKSGGLLAPIIPKGSTTRPRRPLKTTLAGDMEFKRYRHIKSLDEKLAEINKLRAEVEEERRRSQAVALMPVGLDADSEGAAIDTTSGSVGPGSGGGRGGSGGGDRSRSRINSAELSGGEGGSSRPSLRRQHSTSSSTRLQHRGREQDQFQGDQSLGAPDRGVSMSDKEAVARSMLSNRTHGAKEETLNYFGAVNQSMSAGGGLDISGKPGSPTANHGGEMKIYNTLLKAQSASALTKEAAAAAAANPPSSPSLIRSNTARKALGIPSSSSLLSPPGTPPQTPPMDAARAPGSPAASPSLSRQGSPSLSRQGTRKRIAPLSRANTSSAAIGSARGKLSRQNSSKAREAEAEAAAASAAAAQRRLEKQLLLEQRRQKEAELEKQIHDLKNDEILSRQALSHYIQDEENVTTFKELEQKAVGRERSREIERKRRLLTEEEGQRTGPPPEEHSNVYDYYALKLQRTSRGWLARCWFRWYRNMSLKAALMVQATMRGWFGRMRVKRIRLHYNAATYIQKNFRGWRTRVSELPGRFIGSSFEANVVM